MKNAYIHFVVFMLGVLTITGPGCQKEDDDIVKDADGNVYKTVTIGSQTWMAENLKTTRYNDGTPIPNLTTWSDWNDATAGAYCDLKNDESYIGKYGRLYNWYSVESGKIAPKGWHVPTKEEWENLIEYLIANGFNYDGTTIDNKIAKSLGATKDWAESSIEGTLGNSDYPEYNNKTGFNAVPASLRTSTGGFGDPGYNGKWWSFSKYDEGLIHYAWCLELPYNFTCTIIAQTAKTSGLSIRCIKDR